VLLQPVLLSLVLICLVGGINQHSGYKAAPRHNLIIAFHDDADVTVIKALVLDSFLALLLACSLSA
jgi:hypothetical protein